MTSFVLLQILFDQLERSDIVIVELFGRKVVPQIRKLHFVLRVVPDDGLGLDHLLAYLSPFLRNLQLRRASLIVEAFTALVQLVTHIVNFGVV